MKSIEVTTKNQLKEAVDKNYDEIVVNGELAKKLNKAKNIKKLSGATIGVLAAALSVGVALVTSIYKGYDEIEISKNPWKLKLKKKSNC